MKATIIETGKNIDVKLYNGDIYYDTNDAEFYDKSKLSFPPTQGEDIRKEIQIKLPKEFYNVAITPNNELVADTNDSMKWDTLKLPLPNGSWSIKNITDKIVTLSTLPSTQSVNYCARVCDKHEFVEVEQSYIHSGMDKPNVSVSYQCKNCGCFSVNKDGYPENKPSGIDKEEETEIKLDRYSLPKDGSFVEFMVNGEWITGYFTEGDEEYIFTKGTEDVGEPYFAWVNVEKWKYKNATDQPSEPSSIPVVDYEKEAEELLCKMFSHKDHRSLLGRKDTKKAMIEFALQMSPPSDQFTESLRKEPVQTIHALAMRYLQENDLIELRDKLIARTPSDTNCKEIHQLIEWLNKQEIDYAVATPKSIHDAILEKANSLIQQ